MSPTGTHIAFYRFIAVADVHAVVERLRQLSEGLLGSILVATEGVNGMLAGTDEQIAVFQDAAAGDPVVGTIFDTIIYKPTPYERQPFSRLRIRPRPEIVSLGVDGVDAPARVNDIAAADVPPHQWRELITRDDVVLIDNRNSFEYHTGHFVGAIDPGVERFRDFSSYVLANVDQWKAENKTIAMYCTGGIRCEKASPWMQDLGLNVAQLEGGILNYFKVMGDAEKDFEGECFVFDNRITLDTGLCDPGRDREDIPE